MDKRELTETAVALGLTVGSKATIAELEAMIEAANDPAKEAAAIQRRRVNRGSTRRIARATHAFTQATDAFIKEMDLQFYQADEKGERTGEWAFIKELRAMKAGVSETINDQLYPPVEGEAE